MDSFLIWVRLVSFNVSATETNAYCNFVRFSEVSTSSAIP